MQIFRDNLDSLSRPATSNTESKGNRVPGVPLPRNEILFSSTSLSPVFLTNDSQIGGALDYGSEVSSSAINETNDEPEGGDSLLLNAIEQMKRLDEILSVKALQEQDAKRQRREFTDKLWQQFQRDAPKGRVECARETSNTRSFLALEAQVQREELDFEPVFEAEAPECADASALIDPKGTACSSKLSERCLTGTEKPETRQEICCKDSKDKKRHKNFVKRNIELISSEAGPEVLTQEKKERLDELLREIDQEEEDSASEPDAEDNFWAVSVSSGQGYTPEPPDLKQLNHIDSRIRLLLPVEELASFHSSFSNLSDFQGCGSEAGWRSAGVPLPGEKALKDERERRGQERRLQEIQQQLQALTHCQDDDGPDLSEEQLLGLLEECELSETWSRDMDAHCLTPC